MIENPPDRPIFIHGIMPRSGTNFLWDLLLLHPDCARGRTPVNEDFFLEYSDHLVAFIDDVRGAWDPIWGEFGPDLPDRLYAAVGEGLLSFLRIDPSRRLVTKSPSVRHLDRFFSFFPRARLLILVRDGRSVVQSAMTTFAWDFDRACRAWAEAARIIRRFQQAESGRADRWRLVRYEDLIVDPDRHLRSIFEFLGLDSGRYDFDAARNLPVRGSSQFGRAEGRVHWNAVPKDPSFDPKERWRSWSVESVKRFDWLAGKELVDLGYASGRVHLSLADRLRQSLRDGRWVAARTAARAIYRTRVRLALRSRIASGLRSFRIRPAAR
jgi:protein-tyrosine sulfotransferase